MGTGFATKSGFRMGTGPYTEENKCGQLASKNAENAKNAAKCGSHLSSPAVYLHQKWLTFRVERCTIPNTFILPEGRGQQGSLRKTRAVKLLGTHPKCQNVRRI